MAFRTKHSRRMLSLVFLLALARPSLSFSPPLASAKRIQRLSAFGVPIEELEKDLTADEKSITGVVRKCGPSVAFVTSVLPPSSRHQRRRQGRRASAADESKPQGQPLGSGSGFVVGSDGYICTNFHVIERAYGLQDMARQLNQTAEYIRGNVTSLGLLPDGLVENAFAKLRRSASDDPLPQVYVRISTDKAYLPCRIVGVDPDLDLAVLKANATAAAVAFGSSGELLVGQSVVAIGNPFGLDNTVTTGVVSASNRDYNANRRTPIRNCIQTDAAINPGNSGGPLLNLRGQVVGINTAIITTSGSNAGIGFAVPSDQLNPVVDRIILQDRAENGERPNKGWLGVSIIDFPKGASEEDAVLATKNWVTKVDPESPASEAGIRPLVVKDGLVQLGDAIVAIGGNDVSSPFDIQSELATRVQGENVAITLEDQFGERRVVYTVLRSRET